MDLHAQQLPALVDQAKRAIEEAASFEELKGLRDQAETMRAYAKRIRAGEVAQNSCAEIKLRAERRMGQELLLLEKQGPGDYKRSHDETVSPSYADLGIKKQEAHRWQAIGRLPDDEFEDFVRDGLRPGRELTSAAALRLSKALTIVEAVERNRAQSAVVATGDLRAFTGIGFGAISADPPWRFDALSHKGMERSPDTHYGTMDLAGILALGEEVDRLAAADCCLFLWAVDPMLPEAFRVIEAWGFAYKTVAFTWCKTRPSSEAWDMGMGYWTRANPEMCLLATRGRPQRLHADVRQLVVAPRAPHSQKPVEILEGIERLVAGPYLEMFARRQRTGWSAWGNQVERALEVAS